MKITSSKKFRRFTSVALVSSVVVAGGYAVSATPATPSVNVEDVVSNELNITFSVAEGISNALIALSWSVDTEDNEAQTVDATKNQEKLVSLNIAAGNELNEEKTIAVVLEVTEAAATKIANVKVSGVEVGHITENNKTYYILQRGLDVSEEDTNISSDFTITFTEATNDTSISANIFAVADEEQEFLSNDTTLKKESNDDSIEVNIDNANKTVTIYDLNAYAYQLVASLQTNHPDAEFKLIDPDVSFTTETEFDAAGNFGPSLYIIDHYNNNLPYPKLVVKAQDGTIVEYTLVLSQTYPFPY